MSFDPAEHPRAHDGTFAVKKHSAAECELSPSYSVATVHGEQQLTPGLWDPHAAEAFQSGQCVAFAVANAEAAGRTTIVAAFREDDGRLIHAWCPEAEDEGAFIDSDGPWHFDNLAADYDNNYGAGGWWWCPIAVADIRAGEAELGTGLPPQNFDAAAAMLPAFLDTLEPRTAA